MIDKEFYDKFRDMADKITLLEHENYSLHYLLNKFMFDYNPPVCRGVGGVYYCILQVRKDLYHEWKKIYDSLPVRKLE